MAPYPGFEALRDELIGLFRRGVDHDPGEEVFRELALRVFRHQVERNPTYRAFARRRGADPERIERWEDIPPVPTRAFQALPLVAGDPDSVERTFRTSGTTRGPSARGEHHVLSLRLYRESLLPNFRAHLLPDREGLPDGGGLPLVSLIPPPEAAPDSSLSWMMGVVRDELVPPERARFVAPREGELPVAPAIEALEDAAADGSAHLLAGTAFALVHLLDGLVERDARIALPEGTRLMETGGFKGRSRAVSRDELHDLLEERLGLPRSRVVNEYGMTELLSQFYEPVLRGAADVDIPGGGDVRGPPGAPVPAADRWLVGPPWVRTRILDPATLEPLPEGGEGLLCHLDLANAGSVAAVLTEDLGVAGPGGFRVPGRAAGAEPRGCSLAMEDLLRAERSS